MKTVENTIVAFHIGRGGRFYNPGFQKFLGEGEIKKFTDDLFEDNGQYYNGVGDPVGLTEEEYQSGIGTIDIDGKFDTTYTCFLSNCNEEELNLIANSDYWNDDIVDYAKENILHS
jgi:hypothetical protein